MKQPRPVLSKVKEAVFASISDRVEGARFLDLYAGTGRCGIEALKRGAEYSLFVERDPHCVRLIRGELGRLGLSDKADVVRSDVFSKIKRLRERFDIVFLGPPYRDGLVNRTIDALDRAEIVKSDGIVIAEHHKKEGVADKIGSLKKRREKRYGETVLSYFGFDEDSNCR